VYDVKVGSAEVKRMSQNKTNPNDWDEILVRMTGHNNNLKNMTINQNSMMSVSIAGIMALMLTTSANASLLPNGDFESPVQTSGTQFVPVGSSLIPYWLVIGAGGVNVDQTPTAPPNPEYWPGNPTQFLDLTGNTGGGGIQSDPFATVNGQTYTVTFDAYNGSLAYSTIGAYSGPALSLQASGASLVTYSLNAGTGGVLSYTFMATGTATTLTFMDVTHTDSNAGWIDNVGISAVPEAGTMAAGALMLLPLGVSALRIMRKNQLA
jgi:hypothetical protein